MNARLRGVICVALAAALTASAVAAGAGLAQAPAASGLRDVVKVRRMLKGIPQHDNVLGKPGAPVTLVEYIDLQCPGCRFFETAAFPDVVRRLVRTGKLRVVARPIAFIGPDSARGELAALAAARQNRFFDFTELLYFNQGTENTGWLTDAMIKRAASAVPGMDVARLLTERKAKSLRSRAIGFGKQADADHIRGTPTLLIGRTGGSMHEVVAGYGRIAAAVAKAQQK